ncbi:ATP synthase F0 subunit C [Vagococcus intermedius]|uniref:ATP synthase subunit c n=1 Tax=Vagococcus intermedius TaxID=2991418 RepID=A0AAF0CU10_9ENTE|nr:ATP synthase F0 subunit C [Vagococcus intermedius]WEG72985.1 ATP synthase F0 subunit C [Vagococcus intermedius]WEG75071.1 ATP synthase F0 subunit C [Vagococcus intermedius]
MGAGIAAGLAALGAGIGDGLIVAAAMNNISRQPERTKEIKSLMFIGIGLAEALAIISIVISFMIM